MEGWQKGADAVIKMSGAGKERYFQNFPDRKEWFQANYPEHFGRSAAAATSSLKKVTKAKQQKQRLAAIRQAAEKRDQSTVLTPERRLMAQRRREGGEGLAGGMDTVADIRKTIAAGMPVRSGGIGSLFEADKSANTEPDTATTQNEQPKNGYDAETGMYYYNGVPYNTQKEADEAEKNAEESKLSAARLRDELLGNAKIIMGLGDAKDKRYGKKKDPNQPNSQKSETPPPPCSSGLPPDRSTNFRCRDGTSVDGVTPPPSDEPIIPTGRDWAETNPDWGANLGMQYPTNRMDTETERALLMTPQTSAGRRSDRRARKPLTREISIRANEEYAKELAEKTIQECMPMPMNDDDKNWDDMKTWQDNPIPRMSKKSEADEEPGEYDYEGDMAKSQLRSIMHNSKMLHDMLEDKTNLPEWVQSKITLAEDYILTAANYMRGELMNEEVEPPTDYGLADPVAGGKFNAYMQKKKEELAAQAPESDLPFDPNAERPEMPAGKRPEQYRYVRNLARKAMKAGIAATEQPVTHNDLVAQHMNLHNPQDGEVMEEGAGAARRAKSNDLVKRSMLPDKSVIPPGKGFGDDIKKQKITKKVIKSIQKKRMALPTDNPSANELVPQSMLPDVPGYPQGYQMEEHVEEQIIEQPVETPVVEENTNPFVAAGSKFLTRTSARLVYGEKDE